MMSLLVGTHLSFHSVQTNEHSVVVGTPCCLDNGIAVCTGDQTALTGAMLYNRGPDVTCSVVDLIGNRYDAGNYTQMTPSECITTYSSIFVTGNRNIIAIMDTHHQRRTSFYSRRSPSDPAE